MTRQVPEAVTKVLTLDKYFCRAIYIGADFVWVESKQYSLRSWKEFRRLPIRQCAILWPTVLTL